MAYFTREGAPHPAHHNFVRVYGQLATYREDMIRVMSSPKLARGAYAVALWPGELSEWEAVHGDAKPVLYMIEGGSVVRP